MTIGAGRTPNSTAWVAQVLLSLSDSGSPLSGELLLDAVTDAILAVRLREHGSLPATAETVMLGEDLLACTLGGTYAEPEDACFEHERTADTQSTDGTARPSPDHAYVEVVQRLSGRTVLAFISDYDAGPERWIHLFWLAPPPAAT